MAFEDEPHVQRIIAALWSRALTGKAAVLVGAGFSLNAVPLRVGANVMPGWSDLVARMIDSLNPGDDEPTTARRAWLKGQAGASSASLRIAQEYESEFGRDGLDRLILDGVPDVAYGPGEHHRLLLELPWADVLTTNWDTLLERGAKNLDDRVYSVVQTAADIPGAPSPRIVKLHGTLPSHRPFIFTEEDFRTFPERFAPFVNLARQRTMENVLVLMGFSGDDPNFLYWSGWVRDQLGDSAPTIYLVGALDLTPSRRKMLERRNVRPIDLARLAQYREWPERDRHALATRWFLERLTAARPYRRSFWPSVTTPGLTRLTLVQQVPDPRAPQPWPMSDDWSEAEVEKTVLPALRHNRCVYPGWIVAGHQTRAKVWGFLLRNLAQARQKLKDYAPETALAVAFEMNWLCEIALIPLFSDLAEPISAFLPTLQMEDLDSSQKDQAAALGLAMLRQARETGDPEDFVAWEAWSETACTQADHLARLQYERCLFALDEMDYDRLDALLNDWRPTGDSFWMVRKAGLLAENDRADEARRLSKDALALIRQRTDRDREDIASWSREAYALLLRWNCVASELESWNVNRAERDDFTERMMTLGSRGCDAEGEFDWFRTEMGHSAPELPVAEREIRGFDIGTASVNNSWNANAPIVTRIAALQALRYLEETGSPARIARVTVSTGVLTGAATWLEGLQTNRVIGALVRAGDLKAVEAVFTREAVGELEDAEAQVWGDRLLAGLAALSRRLESPQTQRSSEARLTVIVEMLSRLVVRRPKFAAPALAAAVALWSSPGFRPGLDTPLQRLFRRAFKALPAAERSIWATNILELIPPVQNGTRADPASTILADGLVFEQTPELAAQITKLVGQVREPDTRFHAALRLLRLRAIGLCSPAELAAFREALWDPAFVVGGLPTGTPMLLWAVAELDKPARPEVLAAIKARLLSYKDLDGDQAAAEVESILQQLGPQLKLSAKELSRLLNLAIVRAGTPPEEPAFRLFGQGGPPKFAFWRSFATITKASVRYASARAMLAGYLAAPYPSGTAIAVAPLMKAGLLTLDEAASLLECAWQGAGVSSSCAVWGAVDWLSDAAIRALFPARIWSVATDAITARSPDALIASLDFLRSAFAKHPVEVPTEIDERLHRALAALLLDSAPSSKRTRLGYDPGFVRRRAARLVKAMSRAGRGRSDLEAAWNAAALAQTLPEIEIESGLDIDEDEA